MSLDSQVLARIGKQLNAIEGLPCEISLTELSLDAPALFLHQTGGSVTGQTIGGDCDINATFELVYRAPSNSEREVVTASALLDTLIAGKLSEWTRTRTLPDLGEGREALGYEITSLSSVISVEENGEVVYASTFTFSYCQEGNI